MTAKVWERDAARIVLIDSDGRVLLQEVEGLSDAPSVWITPGGGLETGESFAEAAVREIREEVGHHAVLGPCIWLRNHEFTFRGTRVRQREQFFLARCEPFDVDESGLDELEVEIVKGHRWWTLDEIRTSAAVFAPHRLAELLEPLLQGVVPEEPLTVGI